MQAELRKALDAAVEGLDLKAQPQRLYEPIRYLMALGGKRMRPMLSLLAYRLFRSDWERALAPALSIEIFHNFTLMHDDIMDQAPLRRGKATVHEKWNPNVAILSGDVMLVKAYEYLHRVDWLELPAFQTMLARFGQVAAEVCEGQQWDMDFESEDQVSQEQYLEMIRLKTSVLVGFSLELGARLAGASEEMAMTLYRLGESVGLGFQLKDDYLDVFGDPATFGKQVGGDILANKKTFLLINALALAQGKQEERLRYWLQAKDYQPEEKVHAVRQVYQALGIDALTLAEVQTHFDAAQAALQALPLSADAKAPLEQVLNDLMHREV